MKDYAPLADEQVRALENFRPGRPWEHRAKVIALLLLEGVKLAQVIGLSLGDFNYELMIADTGDELIPLQAATVEAIREWLEVRPQKGREQALITSLSRLGGGQRITIEHGLVVALKQLGRLVLGVEMTTRDLHATFYERVLRDMPGSSAEEIAAITGRSTPWLYWKKRNAPR